MFVNGITVFIAASTILLRAVNLRLIQMVGYNTESTQMSQVTQSILGASFVNTSVLLLLCNANFDGTSWWLAGVPLRGQF